MQAPTPVQSTYNKYGSLGQVGMPGSTIAFDSDTGIVQTAAIGFGLAVSLHSASDKAVVLGAPSGNRGFLGISMADVTLANLSATATDKYQVGENIGVLVKGDIVVAPQTNVTAGGDVYFNTVTGELGASNIPNAQQITNAKWLSAYPVTVPGVRAERLAVVRLTAITA